MVSNGSSQDLTVSAPSERRHTERLPVMQSCQYEMSESLNRETVIYHRGSAVCVNMSPGGMMLLMSEPPKVTQVFSVDAPPFGERVSGTRAVETRWVRPSSEQEAEQLYFVGVQFILP